jgi:type IV pilus biogenesis protein CpaD/CtpE
MVTLLPRGTHAAVAMLGLSMMLALPGCTSEAPPPPAHVTLRTCPSWWQFPTDRYSNADSPYLGCVTSINLRAMVADPMDLERGRPLGKADSERETRAVEAYQQGKVKPFQGGGSLSPQSSGGGGAQ